MSLIKEIETRTVEAMKAKDAESLSSYRMLRAAFKNAAIEKRKEELDEEEALEIVARELKKLKDSLSDFTKAGRSDLAERTEKEIALISAFMPEQLSEDEVRSAVKEAVSSTGASGQGDFGRVMGEVMGKVKGRADGGLVTRLVKEELSGS